MPEGLVQQAQQSPEETVSVEDEDSNLTPEEQDNYDAAMKMTGELIYTNDESHQAILDMVTTEDPSGTIADATIFILSKIEEAFQGNYPEELIVVTSDEISDLIMELANESGIVEVTDQIAQEVKTQLVEQLAEEYGTDPTDLQETFGDITDSDVVEMQTMMGGQNA